MSAGIPEPVRKAIDDAGPHAPYFKLGYVDGLITRAFDERLPKKARAVLDEALAVIRYGTDRTEADR